MADTGIADSSARQSISETATLLAANGQITSKPEPNGVLDILVSNHILVRAGDTRAYSFQHQQFQEWYASHSVEHRIMAAAADPAECAALKAEILDLPRMGRTHLFVAGQIRELITRWHAPGMVDRAVRFMLVSGRPEFFDLVWPLITNENEQTSLATLRNLQVVPAVDPRERRRSEDEEAAAENQGRAVKGDCLA